MGPRWLDPRHALAAAGGLVGELTPDSAVERIGELIRTMPAERLDAVMRTPLRRVILDIVFWQLPRRLDQTRAGGVNAAIRWRMTGRGDGQADIYDLVIADGRARVSRGGGESVPRMTITVDAAEFLRIAAGRSNPAAAYFNGKLAVRGDLMQAARLTMLFRIPSASRSDTGRRRSARS